MAAVQKLQTDEEEVLTANRTFYDALHRLDISLMAQVWSHEDWIRCMHPGWDLLVGWDEVQGSWQDIFNSTEQMMVSISRVILHVSADLGDQLQGLFRIAVDRHQANLRIRLRQFSKQMLFFKTALGTICIHALLTLLRLLCMVGFDHH